MSRSFIIPVAALLISFTPLMTSAQNKLKDQKIMVDGKQSPDIKLPLIINSSYSNAKISDFKGKLIIFYSWTTYCAPCIANFPKLDSLQRKFDGQIQIILLAYENEDRIKRMFNKISRLGNRMSLPNAIVDSSTFSNFLNEDGSLGGAIWIDGEGIVLGRTRSEKINADNIKAALEGQLDLKDYSKKKKQLIEIRSEGPLLTMYNGADKTTIYSSKLTGFNSLFAGNSTYFRLPTPDNPHAIIRVFNSTAAALFQIAYGQDTMSSYFEQIKSRVTFLGSYSFFLTKVETPDSAFYKPSLKRSDTLRNKYSFCYELIMPNATIEELFEAMQRDLSRSFPLNAFFEKRIVKCYVLKKIKEGNIFSKNKSASFEKDNFGIRLVNQPISKLINALEYYLTTNARPLVIDETGITQNIDIEIVVNLLRNYEGIKSQLLKYGLYLIEEDKSVDMLVIRERK